MENGGFDVVIGNPPYGAIFSREEADYYATKYSVFHGVRDVYALFIEKSCSLLKADGRLSFIVPSAWLGGPEYKQLRELLLSHKIENLILLPFDVFSDAYIDTAVFILAKQRTYPKHEVLTFIYRKRERLDMIDLQEKNYNRIIQREWKDSEDKKFILNPTALDVLQKIRKQTMLTFEDVVEIKRGVLFDKKLLTKIKTSENSHPYFEGDVYRYEINLVTDNWIEFSDKMKERPKDFKWFEGPRILLRRLVNRRQRLMATYESKTFITNKNLYSLLNKDKSHNIMFILCVLNSQLISYIYLAQVTQATKDDFPQITIKDLLSLPFPNIDRNSRAYSKLVSLVDRMLELHKKRTALPPSAEREKIEREVAITDEKIDEIVYGLYGVTGEERKIIEEG